MALIIAAIGKIKGNPAAAIIDEYQGRLNPKVQMVEIDDRSKKPAAARMAGEAASLLKAVPKGAFCVALDEKGKKFSSLAFAKQLAAWQENHKDVVFLLGGADGHHQSVRAKAQLLLSLSDMTLPHLLARALLVEQIYRAKQIQLGHPYHRA